MQFKICNIRYPLKNIRQLNLVIVNQVQLLHSSLRSQNFAQKTYQFVMEDCPKLKENNFLIHYTTRDLMVEYSDLRSPILDSLLLRRILGFSWTKILMRTI